MREMFVQSSGKFVQIDDQDVGLFMSGMPWHEAGSGYLRGRINKQNVALHKAIGKLMKLTGLVHHADYNPYNCQRSNLESSCWVRNNRDQSIATNNTSGVSGVSWHTAKQKWKVMLGYQYVGIFTDMEDAIKAREEAVAIRDASPINRLLGLQVRRVILNESPREMLIRSGETVLVCHDDFQWCLRYAWTYDKQTNIIKATSGVQPKLHRFIAEMMGLLVNDGDDLVIDHLHGNQFDCRREKLRLITVQENGQNQRTKNGNIYYNTRDRKWCGLITINGFKYQTKYFDYEYEAKEALDVILAEVNPQFRREDED